MRNRQRMVRVGLLLLGGYAAVNGLWALVAPGSFYEQVARYGPENQHILGDAGAFMLALGALLLVSIWRPAWQAPILTVGALMYGLHALNHVLDVDEARSLGRGWADAAGLAVGALLHAALARLAAQDAVDSRRQAGATQRRPRG